MPMLGCSKEGQTLFVYRRLGLMNQIAMRFSSLLVSLQWFDTFFLSAARGDQDWRMLLFSLFRLISDVPEKEHQGR